MIRRDRGKNITYGYANERTGLITHVQFVWIKSLRHMNYAVAYAYDSRCKQTTGEALLEDKK